jgi:hypothetical protein
MRGESFLVGNAKNEPYSQYLRSHWSGDLDGSRSQRSNDDNDSFDPFYCVSFKASLNLEQKLYALSEWHPTTIPSIARFFV